MGKLHRRTCIGYPSNKGIKRVQERSNRIADFARCDAKTGSNLSGYVTHTGGRCLIEPRRAQGSFGDGFITAEIKDLREPWMAHVDAMLADDAMVAAVHQALGSAIPKAAGAADRVSLLRWCFDC